MVKAALLVIALCLVACHGPNDGDVSGVLAIEGDASAGEQLFAGCALATCHGANGDVGEAPELSDTVPEWSDEELARIIAFGIGDMGGSDLSEAEVADLMAYLRERFR